MLKPKTKLSIFTIASTQVTMENSRDHKINKYFFLSVIVIFAVFLLFSLIEFFTAFLAAVMFYVLSKPFVEWLIKRKALEKNFCGIAGDRYLILYYSPTHIVTGYDGVWQSRDDRDQYAGHHHPAAQKSRCHFTAEISCGIDLRQKYCTGRKLSYQFYFFDTEPGIKPIGCDNDDVFFLYFLITNINRMEAAIVFYLPFGRHKIEMFGDELKAQTFSNAVGVPLIAVVQGLSLIFLT
jgi:hypothetical protein